MLRLLLYPEGPSHLLNYQQGTHAFFQPRKNSGEIEVELPCASISRGLVTRKHVSASYHLLLKVILGLLWCKNVCYFFLVSLARALVWLLFHGLLALSFSLFYVICEFDRFRSYLSIISIVSCFPSAISSSFQVIFYLPSVE